ncbi:proton-coupled folate transporter [Latimeria chalumnae]|uniref:proton-coupled folate transporter n=1 Tax=Latimeria chalumnae TaxID=7897 RepID=UPI00313DD0EB
MLETIEKLRKIITVEPVIFLYMTATFLHTQANQQLILTKVCKQLYEEAEVCADLQHHLEESTIVQRQASFIMLGYIAIISLLAVIPSIFLGSWSDCVGRKIVMILPCVSAAISGGLLIAITNVEDMNAYWTILAAAISGISGGYTAVFLSAFSYIADVTDRKSRTKRMGIAESMIFVGGTVGFLLSGLLLQHYSFTNAFGVYCGLNVVSVLYILLWIVEPKCCPDQQNLHHRTDDDKTEEIIKVSLLTYAKQSLKTILKQRPAQDRQKLLFSLVCMFLINLCNVGEQSISLMYLMYPPRSFTSGLYGGFNSTKMLLSGFCLLCVFPLLLRCIRELTLAKFGTIVRAASFILLAFSTNTWMVFIVAVVGAPSGFTVAVIRSVSSQIVEPTEQGAMFSFMSSVETTCLFFGAAIFNSLYPETLSSFPGMCFLVMAVLLIITLILLQ